MTDADNPRRALHRLADAHGVHTSWTDDAGTLHPVSEETLKAVVGAVVNDTISSARDVDEQLAACERSTRTPRIPPVIIAPSGHLAPIEMEHPPQGAVLLGEDASTLAASVRGNAVLLQDHLTPGLYTLTVGAESGHQIATVIATPKPADMKDPPPFGVSAELAGLRDHPDRDQGLGHTGLLGLFAKMLSRHDVGVLGAGSLLPHEPIAGSTHDGPMTRRGWSEWMVDLSAAPGAPALGLDWSSRSDAYETARTCHRRVLTVYSELVGDHPALRAELDRFLVSNPHIARYARFRALGETLSQDWRRWPAPWRTGDLASAPVDEGRELYHQVAQWLADTQLRRVVSEMSARSQRLEFLLDVGVHPYGFDYWNQPHLFSARATSGRPPSSSAPQGTNSLLPTPRTNLARADGYRSFAAAVRHQLAGGLLHLHPADTFHHAWWIPLGADSEHGTFVDQPGDELLAVVALEAHRVGATVVSRRSADDPPDAIAGYKPPAMVKLTELLEPGTEPDRRRIEHIMCDPQVIARLAAARDACTD